MAVWVGKLREAPYNTTVRMLSDAGVATNGEVQIPPAPHFEPNIMKPEEAALSASRPTADARTPAPVARKGLHHRPFMKLRFVLVFELSL